MSCGEKARRIFRQLERVVRLPTEKQSELFIATLFESNIYSLSRYGAYIDYT
jgi:hypothetical protein